MSIHTPTCGRSCPPGYSSSLSTNYAAYNEFTVTYCPFKKHPVTQDSIAARVVLASILPLLESYGQSLASPESPFNERECPMLRCHERFKTPWSLINHLLLCLETPKGDVNCQECQPSHEIKRLMNPVHLWRRLSGGRKRANGASLDWPLAKRGKVDDLDIIDSVESLPRYEDMSKFDQHGQGGELLQDLHELEALISGSDNLSPANSDFPMTRHPLQKSWCEPSHELAAEPVRAFTQQDAVEIDTSRSHFEGMSVSQAALRPAPEDTWSTLCQVSMASEASPVGRRFQQQASADSMSLQSSFYREQDVLGHNTRPRSSYLDPVLRGVSGYNLDNCPDDTDPLQMGYDGNAQWYIGPDFAQAATAKVAHQLESPKTMVGPIAQMTNPGKTRPKVVTQSSSEYRNGQASGLWPLTNYMPITPASTTSGPSATSPNSVRWPFSRLSTSSRTSTKAESPTKVPTSASKAIEFARRRDSGAGRSQQAVLVSPLSQGPADSEDNISLSTDSNQDTVCPYCGHLPKGTKNYRTHLKRHIKIHEKGHELRCQVPGCGSIFAAGRKDNLRQHMNKVHNYSETSPTGSKKSNTPNMTPVSTTSSTSFGYGERRGESLIAQSGAGHYESNGLRRDSSILTGISSDRGNEPDRPQTGGLSPVEESKDNLSKGSDRPDLGPVAWNAPQEGFI